MVAGIAVALGSIISSAGISWLALALIGAVRHGIFWRAQPLDAPCRLFLFYSRGRHRDLHKPVHSFPTRRSSDLWHASTPEPPNQPPANGSVPELPDVA